MNNNNFVINYLPGTRLIQKLNGTTKILLLLASLILTMITFDVRILLPVFVLNLIFLVSLRVKWKKISGLLYFVVFVNLLNVLIMFLVNPTIGTDQIGHMEVWFKIIGRYVVTPETLFYLSVRLIKVVSMFTISLWFILSITPSELAVGLYRLHVPYKICTIVSLGLRSVPDVLRNYNDIKNSLQMRGLELDKKHSSAITRLKQSIKILLPLILSTFEKADLIASAMDLRLYGVGKKRSYYNYRQPTRNDQLFRLLVIIQFIIVILIIVTKSAGSSNVWYP